MKPPLFFNIFESEESHEKFGISLERRNELYDFIGDAIAVAIESPCDPSIPTQYISIHCTNSAELAFCLFTFFTAITSFQASAMALTFYSGERISENKEKIKEYEKLH